jgi:deoxycytidine triphosphate deaminase
VFEGNVASVSSHVYVSESTTVDQFEVSLTVGERFTDRFPAREEHFDAIGASGVLLRPGSQYLFTTQESLRLPYNMFGIIFPKGSLMIRYGVLVPTTKIDPGFHDNLYIFVQNLGQKPYRLGRGDTIASVSFFSTDSTPLAIPETQKPSHMGKMPKLRDSLRGHAQWLTSKMWDFVLAAIGGGLAVLLINLMTGDQ